MDSSWGRPPARIVQCSRGAKVTRSRRFQNPEVRGSRGPSVCWFAGLLACLFLFPLLNQFKSSPALAISLYPAATRFLILNPPSLFSSCLGPTYQAPTRLKAKLPSSQAPDFRFSLAARAPPRHLRVRLADRVRGESHLLPPETDIVNLPCLFYPS